MSDLVRFGAWGGRMASREVTARVELVRGVAQWVLGVKLALWYDLGGVVWS